MVNIKQFCDLLSKDLGIENDAIKEESPGLFALQIEEDTVVKIQQMGEGFSFFCVLAECPKEEQETFLTEIMNANLYGLVTRNHVLGLTEDGNQLTLSRCIDYNIDYKGFSELLQDFCNVALFWREQTLNNLKTV